MRKQLKRLNLPFVFASLFMSVVLWAVVYSQASVMPGLVSFTLVPRGLDESKYIITEMRGSLTVRVEAPEQRLGSIERMEPQGLVDLSLAQPGRRRYPVQLWPEWIRPMVPEYPPLVEVAIEEVVRRQMPVEPETTGERPADAPMIERLAAQNVDPRTVTVSGPRSQVAKVEVVRAVLDLAELNLSKASYMAPLHVLDANGQPVNDVRTEPLFVTITPKISVSSETRVSTVVPTLAGRPAPGFVTSGSDSNPYQVKLQGPATVLSGLERVYTEPVNIQGINKTTTFVTPLRLPQGVGVVEGQDTVSVTVYVRSAPGQGTPRR